MEKNYPNIEVSYEFVDAVAMRLVQWPNSYDVLITSNLFGDILTDEASVISGSMGLMPSASVGSENALYEPIHGSYPEAAGKNIANPIASILSLSMMLDHSASAGVATPPAAKFITGSRPKSATCNAVS